MTQRSSERRRYTRVTQPFDAHYRIYGDFMDTWRKIRTLNVSAAGMRFRSADLIELDQILEIQIILPCLREPLLIHGRVIWSDTKAAGVTENGTEFIDETPEQEEQIDEMVRFLTKHDTTPAGPKGP